MRNNQKHYNNDTLVRSHLVYVIITWNGVRKVHLNKNLARVDSSSPLCWSQAQEKRKGWKPHFCKTTHTQNPQRNTTHRHQPRYSDLFKFFRGRTPGLIAWAVAMNKPG
nr:unnamed protein product [Callosobruchus chinensis]